MHSTGNLFPELAALQREINRVFNDAWLWDERPLFRFPFLPGESARAYPLLNVREDENNVYVTALAPGLNPDQLEINVQQKQVTISGEKQTTNGGVKAEAFHRNERAAGRFVRSITLPVDVDEEKGKADYKNGILTITLPKAETAKPKQIAVEVG